MTTTRARLSPIELKAKVIGRRSAHQWRTRKAARTRSHPPDALVALVSSARCGGRLLVDYWNSVPTVTFADEILHPGIVAGYRLRGRTKAAALRHVQRSLWALPAPICGAKFTFDHLERHGISAEDVAGLRPAPRFIILYRRSLAETFISLQAARQKNEWKRREDAPPFSGLIHVDAAEYLAFAQRVRRDYERLIRRTWVPQRARVVTYEDIATDAQQVFDDVLFPFLELPSSPVSARLKKQIERPISSIVENYEEVKDILEGDAGRQEYVLG